MARNAFWICIGLILPNASALAMAPHGERAGSAAALLGTLQFALAAGFFFFFFLAFNSYADDVRRTADDLE